MLTEAVISLLNQADLHIIDHGIHVRSEMGIYQRIFPYYVMSYIKSGEATLRIDQQNHLTGPGNIIVVPPYVQHDHFKETNHETVFMWWHFNFKIAGIVDLIRFMKLPLISSLKNQESFEQLFLKYSTISNQQGSLSQILLQRAISLEILSILFNELLSNDEELEIAHIPPVFIQIFNDITNLSLKNISLDQLSETYHLNSTYISNRFKRFFDISPITLRRQLIIQQAKVLLSDHQRSISNIALELGFEDTSVFSRFFSNHVDLSPQQFRQTQ